MSLLGELPPITIVSILNAKRNSFDSQAGGSFHQHSLSVIDAKSKDFFTTRGEKAMRIVDMRVQCSDTFSEVLADDEAQIELTIESVVGTALLEVFDTVHVENISVHCGPGTCDEDGDEG